MSNKNTSSISKFLHILFLARREANVGIPTRNCHRKTSRALSSNRGLQQNAWRTFVTSTLVEPFNHFLTRQSIHMRFFSAKAIASRELHRPTKPHPLECDIFYVFLTKMGRDRGIGLRIWTNQLLGASKRETKFEMPLHRTNQQAMTAAVDKR